MKSILATVLLLAGLAGGAAIGWGVSPSRGAEDGPDTLEKPAQRQGPVQQEPIGGDFVRFERQVVIPVVDGDRTQALMLFSIALQMRPGAGEAVYAVKPKLIDAFLRDLFALSHTGAFLSSYTDERVLDEVRAKLLDSARAIVGEDVTDVLLLEVMRQEI